MNGHWVAFMQLCFCSKETSISYLLVFLMQCPFLKPRMKIVCLHIFLIKIGVGVYFLIWLLPFKDWFTYHKTCFFSVLGNGKVSSCTAAEGSFTSLTGLLEVEPLHFTCVSTSDGTRIERDDASTFTGIYLLSLYTFFYYIVYAVISDI